MPLHSPPEALHANQATRLTQWGADGHILTGTPISFSATPLTCQHRWKASRGESVEFIVISLKKDGFDPGNTCRLVLIFTVPVKLQGAHVITGCALSNS